MKTRERPPQLLARAGSGTIFVRLHDGEVVVVSPSTRLTMTDDALIVLNEDKEVARFPRASVYLASFAPIPPPGLA